MTTVRSIDRADIQEQIDWSRETFGPGRRTGGLLQHLRKELIEVEAQPFDLSEWVDIMILALDGAWRHGAAPEEIIAQYHEKMAKNRARSWPDWRESDEDTAIEHVRSDDPPSPEPQDEQQFMRVEGDYAPCRSCHWPVMIVNGQLSQTYAVTLFMRGDKSYFTPHAEDCTALAGSVADREGYVPGDDALSALAADVGEGGSTSGPTPQHQVVDLEPPPAAPKGGPDEPSSGCGGWDYPA